MAMIAERVEAAVAPAEAAAMDGDSLEAEAWAYLAVRSLAGLPISFPRHHRRAAAPHRRRARAGLTAYSPVTPA
jgi:1,6-anhydro-N-acetylmuramate kinase